MNVSLPETGCNILHSATSFYNYSGDGRTRSDWQIYEGVAHKISETYNQYGYSYTGTCLNTGDLVYKPELQIYFPILGALIFIYILFVVYRVIFKRLLP